MDKKGMLLAMIAHYSNGNKTQFAKILGISPQGLNTWISRNTFDAECIYSKCLNISAQWLLTGQGSMLVNEAAEGQEAQAEGATSTATDTQYTQMMDKMLEMAQEIGRLKEQIRQSNIQKDIHASHANTTPIADAG